MTGKLRKAIVRFLDDGNQAALRRALVGERGDDADAARECLKGGRHDGPCDFSGVDGACVIHVRTYRRRMSWLAGCIGEEMDWSKSEMPEVA